MGNRADAADLKSSQHFDEWNAWEKRQQVRGLQEEMIGVLYARVDIIQSHEMHRARVVRPINSWDLGSAQFSSPPASSIRRPHRRGFGLWEGAMEI